MTEAEARVLLAGFDGVGGLEAWIAKQPWQAVPNGWHVAKALDGWRFRLALIPSGIRLTAAAPSWGQPAVWQVLAGG